MPPTISGGSILVNLTNLAAVLRGPCREDPHISKAPKMKAYWVIDILKDIRQFSEKNGMVELAEQLDDAIFVAAREIGMKLAAADTVEVGTGKTRGAAGAFADHEVH